MRDLLEEKGTLSKILNLQPICFAEIKGSPDYPKLIGWLWLYPMWEGTFVTVEVFGLPAQPGKCEQKFFGFHIHSGSACTGNDKDAFADTDGHYNPENCPHPEHAGDFPPLLGNDGYALLMFYTERFQPDEVEGKTVIIHAQPDDFHTQPSGNSGVKIGCGEIRRVK